MDKVHAPGFQTHIKKYSKANALNVLRWKLGEALSGFKQVSRD